MSKWGTATPKERESAPASIFCGPSRSFPIADKEDFDNAVHALGRAKGDTSSIKRCMIGKARANGWTLPDAWQSQNSAGVSGDGTQIAAFDAGAISMDGEWVIRRGKVFEAGDYPDKQFAATPEDLYLAALDFEPVPNDIEHRPSILDGKLGELTRVTLSDDGAALIGETRIPKWLHDQIGDAPLKVSLAWDRATKRIVKNALVLNPRVEDAALMNAYFAGARHSAADRGDFQKVHDLMTQHGAQCEGAQMNDAAKVSVFDTLKALFVGETHAPPAQSPARAEEQGMTAPTDTGTAPAVTFAETPEYKAMQAQLTALQEQNARLERERIAEQAAAFAEAEIAANRAYPAERASLIAAFTDAAEDDRTAPREVTFTVGTETKKGNRVDALRARHAARTAHTLTTEQLTQGAASIVSMHRADNGEPKIAPERKAQLIQLAGFTVEANGK